jgi:hypothetical protein
MTRAATSDISNVVRLPVERRAAPSLDLLHEIAPDCRDVRQVIEALDLDLEMDEMRLAADQAMAERILNEVSPEPGARRNAALAELLTPLIRRAIDLCGRADEAKAAAEAARERLEIARAEGGYWMAPLEYKAASLAEAAARHLVEAYTAYQETVGAARAIRLARHGDVWQPFDLHAEAEALFAGTGARRRGRSPRLAPRTPDGRASDRRPGAVGRSDGMARC